MLFRIDNLQWTRDQEPIARALKARDPAAIVIPATGVGNLRVVARLDTRGMLAALAEAGFAAIPEWQLVG